MAIDSTSPESIHETVREHYAAAAVRASRGDCCAPGDEPIGSELYSALDRSELPDAADSCLARLWQPDRRCRPP